MKKDPRYRQAAKEARWALGLTVLYVIGWCLCAYLPQDTRGPVGFPLWFELSCFYLPVLFIVVAYWVIKIVYQDIPLEHDNTAGEDQ
ncbi:MULTISPECIES: YhdT family protein [Pasteurellaceae]|uniref:YhdT family protein n=1 Tax=Pasteurellaceae TaxID=712 RepID=UPI003567B07E